MALININNSEDQFYRYKMESVQIDTVGKKTILTNGGKICQQLHRPLILLNKFLSNACGSNCVVENEQIVIKGNFSKVVLQKYIFQFIKELVICEECDNPETEYRKDKKEVKLVCMACGKVRILNGKIVKYIHSNFEKIEVESKSIFNYVSFHGAIGGAFGC